MMNSTINLSLPKAMVELTKTRVKTGYFSSVSEVVRAALRQYLLTPELPTYPMSPTTETTAIQALADYHQGKTKFLKNPQDLGNL